MFPTKHFSKRVHSSLKGRVANMPRKTKCAYCGADLVGDAALEVACEIPYEEWKDPFDPKSSTKVILVGLAPPEWTGGQKSLDRVKYLYRSPEGPLPQTGTVRWLRDALGDAILDTPLEKEYCELSKYYRSKDQGNRGDFLRALRDDGIVWDDCIMHPIPTREVLRMTRDKDLMNRFSKQLIAKPFRRILFLSSSESHRTICGRIKTELGESESKKGKSLYVFRTSFWPAYDGASKEELHRRRSLELRTGLSTSLSD
jgi:hypothetical protein